jgi:hypothetical protein
MPGTIRKYNAKKDKKAGQRVWQECGWISDEKNELEAFEQFVRCGDAWVYEINGEAECLVISTPARFVHTGTPLDLAAITAVTTSRIARNLGAASLTLAHVVAEQAAKGAHVSGLGVFEQGFYNRLGYGNGTYEHWVNFDPAWLVDLGKPRIPVRLGVDDWEEIHAARLKRYKLHGAVDLIPPGISRSEMGFFKKSFGLGYRENRRLTHFFCGHTDNVENGPYTIDWIVYESLDQLRELLALIRGLGDQVRLIRMHEPKHIQLQSLLKKPFQLFAVSDRAKNQSKVFAYAYWQLRMIDIPSCISAISTPDALEFNLRLSDPIHALLPEGSKWRGVEGEYAVSLGVTSSAEPEPRNDLPVLEASINDFSRFWMGSARADALAAFASFRAEQDLINALDKSVRLPPPEPGWDY